MARRSMIATSVRHSTESLKPRTNEVCVAGAKAAPRLLTQTTDGTEDTKTARRPQPERRFCKTT